jgi:flagella basal body P-ring formation protein FlgA
MIPLLAIFAAAAACISVPGAHITAGDLAKAVPAFTPADPAAEVSYAPSPGVRRVFRGAELGQALAHLGFTPGTAAPEDVCFERVQVPLTNERVSEAMHETLGPAARIEIVELSHFPAPPGQVVFPRESLGYPPIAFWHGYVRYDGDKKFSVWARVKISVASVQLIALEDLKPGVPIRASQVKVIQSEGFPEKHVAPASADAIDGCIPRHFIPADSPVWADSYNPPNDINKGDRVVVFVHSGKADLSFDADAESSGRKGDQVFIKNPDSGRVFRALVQGPGKAGVQTFR